MRKTKHISEEIKVMKTFCENRTPEQQLRVYNRLLIFSGLAIALIAGVMIYDMVTGREVDASRCTLLCANLALLSVNSRNRRNLLEQM